MKPTICFNKPLHFPSIFTLIQSSVFRDVTGTCSLLSFFKMGLEVSLV